MPQPSPAPPDHLDPLIERVAASTGLGVGPARRVVLDVIAYLDETPEAYVARRHRELKQHAGLRNEAIFELLRRELAERPFAAPALTERQLRRIIYG